MPPNRHHGHEHNHALYNHSDNLVCQLSQSLTTTAATKPPTTTTTTTTTSRNQNDNDDHLGHMIATTAPNRNHDHEHDHVLYNHSDSLLCQFAQPLTTTATILPWTSALPKTWRHV